MFPRAAALAVVLLLVAAHAAVQKHQVVRIGFIPSATDATNNGAFQTRYSSQLAAFLAAVADMRSKYAATNITVEFAVRDAQSRFTSASRVLTNLATNAFQSTFPAHGVIGSDTTAVSSGIAYASNDFDMGQISFGSDAAFLGSGSMFPSFMRNFVSNGYEAIAMYVPRSSTARPSSTLSLTFFYTTSCTRRPTFSRADEQNRADLLNKGFKWQRFVVCYSTDVYGTFALQVRAPSSLSRRCSSLSSVKRVTYGRPMVHSLSPRHRHRHCRHCRRCCHLQLWNTRAAKLGLQTIATVPITPGVAVTNFTNAKVGAESEDCVMSTTSSSPPPLHLTHPNTHHGSCTRRCKGWLRWMPVSGYYCRTTSPACTTFGKWRRRSSRSTRTSWASGSLLPTECACVSVQCVSVYVSGRLVFLECQRYERQCD